MFLRGLVFAAAVGVAALAFAPMAKDAQGAVASGGSGGASVAAGQARTVIAETANSLALLATPVPGVKVDEVTLREFAGMATQALGLGLVIANSVDGSHMMGSFDLPSGSVTHEGMLRILAAETDTRWHVWGKTVYLVDEDSRIPVPQYVVTTDVMDILTALGQREAALRKTVDPDHLTLSRNRQAGAGGDDGEFRSPEIPGIVDLCVDRLEDAIDDGLPELNWEGSGNVRIGPDGLVIARLRPQGHAQLESLLADIRKSLKIGG
jgi:hypothetical protein